MTDTSPERMAAIKRAAKIDGYYSDIVVIRALLAKVAELEGQLINRTEETDDQDERIVSLDQPQLPGPKLDDHIGRILEGPARPPGGWAHPYSTNLRFALRVVEKMLTDKHPYVVTLHGNTCEVCRPRWSGSHYQKGESLAHAICLAFLAARNDGIGRWND